MGASGRRPLLSEVSTGEQGADGLAAVSARFLSGFRRTGPGSGTPGRAGPDRTGPRPAYPGVPTTQGAGARRTVTPRKFSDSVGIGVGFFPRFSQFSRLPGSRRRGEKWPLWPFRFPRYPAFPFYSRDLPSLVDYTSQISDTESDRTDGYLSPSSLSLRESRRLRGGRNRRGRPPFEELHVSSDPVEPAQRVQYPRV